MKTPYAVYLDPDCLVYLKKRLLLKQYIKAKERILQGSDAAGTQFRQREPKSDGVRYFRINRKYRARGSFDLEGNFVVTHIDDHQ